MSRPSASVPSRKRPDAALVPDRRRAHGVAELLDRANRARRSRRRWPARTMSAEDDERRAPRRGSPRIAAQKARGAAPVPARTGVSAMATSAAMADPRVDRAVDQIDDQVDEDDDARDQHDAALQRRIVAPRDRTRSANCRRRARRRSFRSARRRPSARRPAGR